MKVAIITGDRHAQVEQWAHRIRTALVDHEVDLVIHGGARGIDSIAGDIAYDMNLDVIIAPADWRKHGKAAGPIRNRQMLETLTGFIGNNGAEGIVLAFHPDIANSKGTKDMVAQAIRSGVEVDMHS